MSWGYSDYYSTPSVAEQKRRAEKQLATLRKKEPDIEPVVIEGRKIAKTWWGGPGAKTWSATPITPTASAGAAPM